MRQAMPFTGTPPAVAAGDRIEIQDAAGDWHPAVALSGPRYDHETAYGRTVWLTVAVRTEDGYEVNWGAEKVRPVTPASDGEEPSHA